tara:strand:+ start:243 stop:1328 length:1086 start_codon:yes stop_codon:yes gene_type:complete
MIEKTMPKLIYIIGPNFCVKSLAHESLEMLSKEYEVICVSEGPFISEKFFNHVPIEFTREPNVFKDIISLVQLIKIIWTNRNAKKIVISTPKIAFLGSLACIINMKKYSYLHRGAVYQNFNGIKLKLYKSMDKFIILFSNKTSFISESLFKWVKNELNLKNINYSREYNSSKGVDLKKFYPLKNKTYGENINIGFCGRVARDKGFEEIISLIKNYSDNSNINIYVKGKIELNDKDEDIFTELIKNKEVYFEKWDENVANFYRRIDILFFPSKREGFGNVAAEAAACGIPTVAYNIPGIRDAIGNNISGLLFDENTNLDEEIDLIINDKEKLEYLSNNCREYAKNNFDQIKVLKDLHKSLGL